MDMVRPTQSAETPSVIKVSFHLHADQVRQLREVAIRRNQSMTQVLRHGIALEYWLQREVDEGGSIIIETPYRSVGGNFFSLLFDLGPKRKQITLGQGN